MYKRQGVGGKKHIIISAAQMAVYLRTLLGTPDYPDDGENGYNTPQAGDIIAVSYTHLDVYKRQPEQFARLSGFKAGNQVCIPWKTCWGCPNYNFFGIVAVLLFRNGHDVFY